MGCNGCSCVKIQTLDTFNEFFFFLTLKMNIYLLHIHTYILNYKWFHSSFVFLRAKYNKAEISIMTLLNYYPIIFLASKNLVHATL